MTKAKMTKRALLSSALALFLCFAMLLGTTFAWFTDSVTSANNIIMSGNLDIELEYWDGTEWKTVAGASDILTNTLWEPGAAEVAYLRVANAGSLALKYQLGINIVSETAGVNVAGDPFNLSDYIMFGVVESTTFAEYANRDAAVAAVTNANKISAGYTKADSLAANAAPVYLALVVYMPTSVGNEANHDGTNVPKIELGINVVATQMTAEEDSFNNQYDKDATLPKVTASSAPIVNGQDTVVTAYDVDEFMDSATAKIPATAAKEEGATSYTLVITSLENAYGGITVEGPQGFNAYDIEVVGLDENASQAVEMTLQLEAGLSGLKLYHYDEEINFAYDAATGILTFIATDFSPYTIVFDDSWDGSVDTTWYNDAESTFVLTEPAQLAGVSALAASGNTFANKTIVLGADMYLGGKKWTPVVKFTGTFNGDGHIISNFAIDATASNGGFFATLTSADGVTPATVKNLTLSNITASVGNTRFGAVVANINKTNIDNVTVKDLTVTTTASKGFIAGLASYGTINSEVAVKNCTVENFTVNAEKGAMQIGGIFDFIQRNGTEADGTNVLSNLHVKNFKVVVNDTDGYCDVGGLMGQTQSVWQNPHFVNCSVSGLDVTASGTVVNVGGFMCYPGSYTYADNCTVEGKIDVSGVTKASSYAGGFFGDYGWGDNNGKGDHKVTNCVADVDIITNVATAGGFTGAGINTENRNKNITFTNCEAKGSVTVADGGTAIIGGFVGKTDRGIYVNCTAAQAPFIGLVMDGYTLTDDGNGTLTVAK